MQNTEINGKKEQKTEKRKKRAERRKFNWNLPFIWFVKITSSPILFFYFKSRIIGKKRAGSLKHRTILVANHTSTWDPVLLNYVFPTRQICFMTASVMFKYNVLFTWFLNRLGAFPVVRDTADFSALSQANRILFEDKILGIFPEGKRSLDGNMLPFRPGAVITALNTDTPIVPVYIGGKYGLFHRKTVVVGEKINLRDYCPEIHPTSDKIRELCALVQDKVSQLSLEIPKKPCKGDLPSPAIGADAAL